MNSPFILKTAAPTIAISGLLLALGVAAAWNVQRQQSNSSELVAKEVHGIIAAQDLYIDLREIRHQLQQYARSSEKRHLLECRRLQQEGPPHIRRARELARTPQEEESIQIVAQEWLQFSERLDRFTSEGNEDATSGAISVDDLLAEITRVIDPAKNHLTLNRDVIDRTNEANQRTNEQLRQAFLLLGICGSAAGLVTGLLIARGISRSIVQLDVSVRGAAGRLREIVGPVTISRSGGLRELEAGLQQMENHIGTVVERLQQRELEVLRSEQMSALGQLAAGMAHELRNPLMPMKMLVQAAVERNDGVGLHGKQLKVVEEEIGQLEKSIQDFLDFARPPKLEKTKVAVTAIVQQAIELIFVRAERQGISIRCDLTTEPLVIEADAVQLRQVILNLLLNACDAQPEGGRITVTVSRERLAEEATSSINSMGTEWVRVSLRDAGPGLAAEILEHIFEPFHSTKESGTGLGLSICHRIVEAHEGRIEGANDPHGGAVFSIYLPLQQNGATAVQTPQSG